MRTEEFIEAFSKEYEEKEKFAELQQNVPVGLDSFERVVCAFKGGLSLRHIAVTGEKKSAFIQRLLITFSCLYDDSELCAFILSPNREYGELLRLKALDVTAPYIRDSADVENATAILKELIRLKETSKTPKLVLVLDGLEEISGYNKNGDFEEYRAIFDLLARRKDVYVVTGIDMQKSIFSGYPGAFVGIGNCLVSTKENGKADVTYVQSDCSLSMPILVFYPDSPSVTESISFLNALAENYGEGNG